MNKTELTNKVAQKAELDKKTAEKAVNALFETLTEAFEAEEKIQIMGFGTFEVRERPAHIGRNPATGESIEIAATKTPVFKASKTLKK